MNQQPISKVERLQNGTVSLHSIFTTIQGEGPFRGHKAVFVRLAGCNLQCPMCDTEYSEGATLTGKDFIVDEVKDQGKGTKLVVITGGEPFRQNIRGVVRRLLGEGFSVQIETNGVLFLDLPYTDPNLTVVCSPKTGKVHPRLLPNIDAYKYVVTAGEVNEDDGLPIAVLGHPLVNADHVARPPEDFDGEVYVQPADMGGHLENENMEAAVKACLDHGYILNLQIHKYAGLE